MEIISICTRMRGLVSLSSFRYKFEQLYPVVARSWGTLSTSTPKKQNANDSTEGDRILNEKAETIVAFCRPPPNPPVFGPIVALSLLEMWSSRDNDDE